MKRSEVEKTIFGIQNGGHEIKRVRLVMASGLWLSQRTVILTFTNFPPRSGRLVHPDGGLVACPFTWEAHVSLLEEHL